jgi:hypothetical protein
MKGIEMWERRINKRKVRKAKLKSKCTINKYDERQIKEM